MKWTNYEYGNIDDFASRSVYKDIAVKFNKTLWKRLYGAFRSMRIERKRCGHDYDCCGCLCSVDVEIQSLGTGKGIRVIKTAHYNY